MQKYIDRFWTKVNKTNTCWEWMAATTKEGHGMYSYNGKTIGAHRFSALIAGFDIDNKLVCHHCDNPKCVNPEHFFTGNAIDNVNDMIKKGRYRNGARKKIMTPAGEFDSRLAAAAHYNVSAPTIGNRMIREPTQYYYV